MSADSCPPILAQLLLSNVSIDGTLGVGYLGVVISTIVYGITCCQAFYYFRSQRAKRDRWHLKMLVTVLMVASTVQEGVIIHIMYNMVITNFANPCFLLASVVWSLPTEILLDGIIVLGVNGFLVYRTWQLGRNIYISSFCVMLILIEFSLSTVEGIKLLLFRGTMIADEQAQQHIGLISIAFYVGGSIVISITLLFYLQRSRTGFRRSNSLINQIMVLTVTTGAVPAIVDLAQLVMYIVAPEKFYVLLFNFLSAKVSLNALLTILNMRENLSSVTTTSIEGVNSIPLHKLGPGTPRPQHSGLCVTRESDTDCEVIHSSTKPNSEGKASNGTVEEPFVLEAAAFRPATSVQIV